MSDFSLREAGHDPSRPASWLLDAMVAVLEGDGERLIAIGGGCSIRAAVIVLTFAPEALARAELLCGPGSEVSNAVERARLAQIRHERRIPVQLELVPAA